MPDILQENVGLVVILLVVSVVVWVVAKVIYYARRSEEQWQAVDRSRLRPWDDDDDWNDNDSS